MNRSKVINFLLIIISALLFSNNESFAQDKNADKEVIIIEKTYDSEGNIISKKTKRFNGKYSEDQIQEFIDEGPLPETRSYDLEGLGFGEDVQSLFDLKSQRPTIGINLNFENGQALVEKVMAGSGAERAEIRIGDRLIAVNGLPISSIDDIYDVLDKKSKGDKIKVVVFRDGEEIEKEVELGLHSNNGLFFEFPEGGSFGLFGDGESIMPFDIDSLFQGLKGKGGLEKGFDYDSFRDLDFGNHTDNGEKSARPTLGVYIEDSGAEVLITGIVEDSPASKGGLKSDDVILRINDNVVTSFMEVSAIINTKKIGDTILLEIAREGKTHKIEVILE